MEVVKYTVLTISDTCSGDNNKDKSGKLIIDILNNINAKLLSYDIIADEKDLIKQKLLYYCDCLKTDIVITTGGTGLGPRDVTPEITQEIAEKNIPGISEYIRAESIKKTKNAILSRGVCAMRGKSVIINLPGSPKAVSECLGFILDVIPHMIKMIEGEGH